MGRHRNRRAAVVTSASAAITTLPNCECSVKEVGGASGLQVRRFDTSIDG